MMYIKYESLTEEKLEELVEFVDWSLVPSHLITDYIKEKFHFIEKLKLRIWFEDLLLSLEKVEKNEILPYYIYYLKDETAVMLFDLKTNILLCNYEKIWKVFKKIFGEFHNDIFYFIKNIAEKILKLKKIIPGPTSPTF